MEHKPTTEDVKVDKRTRRVEEFAPAKINLTLHVGPRISSRRHLLQSIVAFADVGDRMILEEGPNELAVIGPFASSLVDQHDNLVTRALSIILTTSSVRITLDKQLPIASGMGGGSTDAAAALRAARKFYELKISDNELEVLVADLGADIPACVRSHSALMNGAGGTIITPIELPKLCAVLVNTGLQVSTKLVFSCFESMGISGVLEHNIPSGADVSTTIEALVHARNDLEAPAIYLVPHINKVLTRLRNDPRVRLARMSGSGATCFALVDDIRIAHDFAGQLQKEQSGWWIQPTQLCYGRFRCRVRLFTVVYGHSNVRPGIRSEGGVFIFGQFGTKVQIYIQQSVSSNLCLVPGWHGTYQTISSSTSKQHSSVAFLYSSFERPEEVYFVKHIDEPPWDKAITLENALLTTRDLSRAKLYRCISPDDNRMIEGILHYPPGQFEHKNLPLFVYLHGGPTDASLNRLQTNFYTWAPLAATEGWLVLECNYRGSTGYGDQFLNELSGELLSRPGRDILAGVDNLVNDGIADPTRLNIGGFSFGGFLTNWLITQTTRFNAALSGAGASELISMWGTSDLPSFLIPLMHGFPWEASEIYENESIMNKLSKVQTPTLITTGANDIRVPVDQSYVLERGLTSLGVPAKLLLFPNEGHMLRNNPWHEKIKAREELE